MVRALARRARTLNALGFSAFFLESRDLGEDDRSLERASYKAGSLGAKNRPAWDSLWRMRSIVVALLLSTVALSGCKRKELEAALAEANKKLEATEAELGAEKGKNKTLTEQNQTLEQKITELEAQIAKLSTDIKVLEEQNADLARKAGATQDELKTLRAEKAKRMAELQVYKDLFGKLKALVDAGTIQVEFRKGRLVVKLASSILFDSGKTELKAEGQTALSSLATALKSLNDREFLVAGHTDNVPIKTAKFKNNWDLSTARAVEVVQYLITQGMTSSNIGAAGYGENDPVADNANEDGKAQNRRIEVILMPLLGDIPELKAMLTGGKS
jgi:chemotaxis protein MotB